MKHHATELAGVVVIEPTIHHDDRGAFFESYNEQAFARAIGRSPRFVQSNQSCSQAGVLRGLHYQVAPHEQAKLVRVVHGSAFDVAVDLRPASPTYLRWTAAELSAANRLQLWIPEGFAHGFLALEDDTVLLYQTTDYWSRPAERCIAWDDPALGIGWPLTRPPILSDKDRAALPAAAVLAAETETKSNSRD